jgi:hypothetical protein
MSGTMITMANHGILTQALPPIIDAIIRNIPDTHAIGFVPKPIMIGHHTNTANHPVVEHVLKTGQYFGLRKPDLLSDTGIGCRIERKPALCEGNEIAVYRV